jgi:hypothetical protein
MLANPPLQLHRFVDLSHAEVLSLPFLVPHLVLLCPFLLALDLLFGCILLSHLLTQLFHLIGNVLGICLLLQLLRGVYH